MRSYLFAYALLLGTAGCFSPDLTNSTFTCDTTTANLCPEGQKCVQGVCAAPAAQSENPDLAGTQAATLGPTEGCQPTDTSGGQGFLISAPNKAKVYACPTKYKTSGATAAADAQCKPPYTMCVNANNIDMAACSKAGQFMGGFFIANVKANRRFGGGSNPITCGGNQGTTLQTWAGCGGSAVALSCSGFTAGLDCYPPNNGFSCGGYNLSDATNTDGVSGVLCCSP